MRYEYEADNGAPLVLVASMAKPPPGVVTQGARTFRRVTCFQKGAKSRTKVARNRHGDRIGNDSLGRWDPFSEKFDSKGRPVFDSKLEQNERDRRAAAAGDFQGPLELSQPGDRPHIMRADD